MGTFLVTPRMTPALRARVERAVSGRARAKHYAKMFGTGASPFGDRTVLRPALLLPVLALLAITGAGVVMVRREKRALEAERSAILTEIEASRGAMPKGHEGLVAETERWLVEAASDGDTVELIDATLTPAGALDKALARPAVYVHAPASELRDARLLDDAVRGSDKDAFLVCLLHPPASTSERDLLAKVRGVYFAGAKVDAESANVRRFADVWLGLAVLSPAFEGSVEAAEDRAALKRLRRELQKAPVASAKRAALAEIMLIAADSKGGARVTIVDLTTKKTLLRVYRRAPTQTWSENAFVHHEELDACNVAMAVRKAVVP